MDSNTQLQAVENNSVTEFSDYGNIEALIAFCTPIAKSSFSPFRDVNDVVAAALWARQKNFPLLDVLGHVAIFNGKIAPDSHLIAATIQRYNIKVTVKEDYAPIYSYVHGETGFLHDTVHDNPNKFDIYYSMAAVNEAIKISTTKTIVLQTEIVDYRTTLIFERLTTKGKLTAIGQFSIMDATQAGLAGKDNWKKYPKQCLYARAYSLGARRIADDLIYGAYTPEELGDSKFDQTLEYADYTETE